MRNLKWRCISCKKERCVCGRYMYEAYCAECEAAAQRVALLDSDLQVETEARLGQLDKLAGLERENKRLRDKLEILYEYHKKDANRLIAASIREVLEGGGD